MTPRIAAVIPTYNRIDWLCRAVASVVEQSLPAEQYEIIVVDNRSTDGTAQRITKQFGHVPHLRVVTEPVQGLNPARNRGWRETQAPLVAYLDDDAIASPRWLEAMIEAFASTSPPPGAVGGHIEPLWESPRPDWLPDELMWCYSVLDYAPDLTEMQPPVYPIGANIAFLRSAVESVGGFQEGLDRVGNNLLSGGETRLVQVLRDHGHRCLYQPRASVRHLVPTRRLTQNWLVDRAYWQGLSETRIRLDRQRLSMHWRVRLGWRDALPLLCRRDLRRIMRQPATDPATMSRRCDLWKRWGAAMGLLRLWQ